MKVNTMHRIDYWFGVPLCFLTSYLLKLRRFLPVRTIYNTSPQRSKALILALSEMGSIVLAEPALRKIAANNELFFITFKRSEGILKLLQLVPESNICCIDISSPWQFIKDSWRCLRWARKQRLQWVIDFELFSRFSALLSAFSGANYRVGFYAYCTEGLYRGNLLTHKVAYNTHIHISKNFLSLAHAMQKCVPLKQHLPLTKVSIGDEQIQLQTRKIKDSDKHAMQQLIQSYYKDYTPHRFELIIINTQGGDLLPMRNWGQTSFLHLSRMILDNFSRAIIILTGSTDDYLAIERLTSELKHSRAINFAGAIELQQILALYEISTLMVSNDSGPNHFAALVNLPTYTLFGPETPKLYGSLGKTTNIYKKLACSPCVSAANHRKTVCVDNQCMQQISVQEVFEHIASHLNRIAAQ